MSLFQPPEVHKEPRLGPNYQSHLYCCLDNTSPRPASTSTSAAASGCSIPRRRGRSGVTLLVSTKRTADLHSQVTLPLKMCSQVTIDFHSKVSHLSRRAHKLPLTFTLKSATSQNMLASALLTFIHKSPYLSRRACKCTIYCHSQVSHLSRRACKCTVTFSHKSLLLLTFGGLTTVARFYFRGAVILFLRA